MRFSQIKYLIMIPFLVLSIWVSSWGLADIFAYQALRYERSWSARDTVATLAEWDEAKSWALLAKQFNSHNPDYSEMLGRLYYWRFLVEDQPVSSLAEQNEYLDQGLSYLRSAIEKRPTWPETWAYLIRLKSVAGNLDDEYWYAWDKSYQLGRWETYVQEKLLESGLQHWENFTVVQQNKMLSVLDDMMSKPYSQLTAFSLIDFYERFSELCPRVSAALLDNIKIMKDQCLELAPDSSAS